MTIDEIINGSSEKFTGLIPFIRDYMDNIEIDVDTRGTVKRYLDFISMRASGKLMTTAKYVSYQDLLGLCKTEQRDCSFEILYAVECKGKKSQL